MSFIHFTFILLAVCWRSIKFKEKKILDNRNFLFLFLIGPQVVTFTLIEQFFLYHFVCVSHIEIILKIIYLNDWTLNMCVKSVKLQAKMCTLNLFNIARKDMHAMNLITNYLKKNIVECKEVLSLVLKSSSNENFVSIMPFISRYTLLYSASFSKTYFNKKKKKWKTAERIKIL